MFFLSLNQYLMIGQLNWLHTWRNRTSCFRKRTNGKNHSKCQSIRAHTSCLQLHITFAGQAVIKRPHRMCSLTELIRTYFVQCQIGNKFVQITFTGIFGFSFQFAIFSMAHDIGGHIHTNNHIGWFYTNKWSSMNGEWFLFWFLFLCFETLLKPQPIHLAHCRWRCSNMMRGERVTIHTTNC